MRSLSAFLLLLIAACAAPSPRVASPAPAKTAPSPPAVATAPAPTLTPLPEHLSEWIDEYASSLGKEWGEVSAFSGYLLVARNGTPVFAKGYLKANRTTGAAIDGDTRFRIASVTKQFTAVAVLQLAEKGKLRLEDPLSKYVSGLAFGDRVTLHQCLSHTSGIPELVDIDGMMHDGKSHPRDQVVAAFATKPLQFEPGTDWRYTNANFYMLAMVIEKASGQSFEDYLQKNVLGPAGMTRSTTIDDPDAPNTARGYTDMTQKELGPCGVVDMSIPSGAGALSSTPNDLVRWDRALTGNALLTNESKRRMFTGGATRLWLWHWHWDNCWARSAWAQRRHRGVQIAAHPRA